MATAGMYRRVLPSPPAIDFASPEGKQIFVESLQNGTTEGFFKLISYFQTQSEPAYCGLASISMVLNALAIDPGRKWKGPWRWFDESMLDCCEPLEKIKDKGITFAKVACLAICNGAKVEASRTNQCTVDDFRRHVIACTSTEECHAITSYNRKLFQQTGSGHFSPIGGYHAGRDMVLILDVARFKYPPHWVPLELLWEAMDTIDVATGLKRGFMIISRPQTATSLLYTLSCKNDSWASTAKHLVDVIPVLLRSDDVHDVQKVLSIVVTSLPTNFGGFIKWVVEVRREDDIYSSLSKEEKGRLDVKEEVLKQVKETKLYRYVTEWLFSTDPSCNTILSIHHKDIIELPNKFCRKSNSGTYLEANGDRTGISVPGTGASISSNQGMDILIPSYEKSGCLSSSPANCIEKQQGHGDGLTALLLALSPQTWLGIKDEKLLEEMCSLVSTDSLPLLLQEEVLYLRKQLHILKQCVDDELAVPTVP